MVVAPALTTEEFDLLASGVEVVAESASDAELKARLRWAAGRARPVDDATAAFAAHLPDGVALIDAEEHVHLLNPTGAAMLGAADVPMGLHLHEYVCAVDVPAAKLAIRDLLEGTAGATSDLLVVRRDGKKAILSVSARWLRREPGQVILAFRDVTAERATDHDLRRTRDFLERLIDSSTDAIVASDVSGQLLVFNRAAERMFGISAERARAGLSVVDLYPQGGAREIARLLLEAPSGRVDAVRAYAKSTADDLIPIEVSASRVLVEGEEVASVALMRDLRERVRVEGELARTRARLLDAEKQTAITALAGATAHELNQPLTVIVGFVDLLRRKAAEPHQAPLEAIARETERMAEIVKKIAKLTRIETMSYPGERQIADLEKSTGPRSSPPVVRR